MGEFNSISMILASPRIRIQITPAIQPPQGRSKVPSSMWPLKFWMKCWQSQTSRSKMSGRSEWSRINCALSDSHSRRIHQPQLSRQSLLLLMTRSRTSSTQMSSRALSIGCSPRTLSRDHLFKNWQKSQSLGMLSKTCSKNPREKYCLSSEIRCFRKTLLSKQISPFSHLKMQQYLTLCYIIKNLLLQSLKLIYLLGMIM